MDYTLEAFKNWDVVADYESDETSVELFAADGKSLGKYGYSRFSTEDFLRFKKAERSGK